MELALPTTATYVAQMRWLLGEVVMGETSKKRERGRVGLGKTRLTATVDVQFA